MLFTCTPNLDNMDFRVSVPFKPVVSYLSLLVRVEAFSAVLHVHGSGGHFGHRYVLGVPTIPGDPCVLLLFVLVNCEGLGQLLSPAEFLLVVIYWFSDNKHV